MIFFWRAHRKTGCQFNQFQSIKLYGWKRSTIFLQSIKREGIESIFKNTDARLRVWGGSGHMPALVGLVRLWIRDKFKASPSTVFQGWLSAFAKISRKSFSLLASLWRKKMQSKLAITFFSVRGKTQSITSLSSIATVHTLHQQKSDHFPYGHWWPLP